MVHRVALRAGRRQTPLRQAARRVPRGRSEGDRHRDAAERDAGRVRRPCLRPPARRRGRYSPPLPLLVAAAATYLSVAAAADAPAVRRGYTYVNLDDCWIHPNRTADGQLQPDPNRFPAGIEELTGWLHERHFKFGLCTSPHSPSSATPCAPASARREASCVQTPRAASAPAPTAATTRATARGSIGRTPRYRATGSTTTRTRAPSPAGTWTI